MSQKHLPERACGFESRFRHPIIGRVTLSAAGFVNKSADIHRLCGEALDRLGVAWRFSKPTTISVARREAVARLDMFVGPKY